jgi:hypothetical protein
MRAGAGCSSSMASWAMTNGIVHHHDRHQMMAVTGGKQRTEAELRALLIPALVSQVTPPFLLEAEAV